MVSLADISINRSVEGTVPTADDLMQVPMQTVLTPQGAGGDERRMQVRAYNFWLSLVANDELPAIEDLRPEELDDLGPSGVVLDLTLGRENPSILYIGEKLAAACGTSDEIMTAGDVPGRSLLARLTEHGLEVVANRSPVGFDAEFVDTAGRLILYRSILLPFSSDGRTIDFIFGVISWKEDAVAVTPAAPPQLERPAIHATAPAEPTELVEPIAQRLPVKDSETALGAEPEPTTEVTPCVDLRNALDAARLAAEAFGASEARSHAALYAALSRAHDLALQASRDPADFNDLLADAGLVASPRAPLLPLAKLVFGPGYDKTRLAEYAAVLGAAQRLGLERGTVADWLAGTAGGLRAVISEERRLRRAQSGQPARRSALKPGTARKLKALPAMSTGVGFAADGEFALLVARRGAMGAVEVLGDAGDVRLLEAAAKRLLG